jgi:very-short-patch-repair endonuclease
MTKLYILAGIVIAIVIILAVLKERFDGGDTEEEKKKYQYKRKNFFLTRAEHECFDALMAAVGNDYLIFAQVHLPTLIDNKVVGQNWRAAFRHINGKSVDFVLCDKAYISPKLAIELDDKTHERPERQERDVEVERILDEAGVPLLRLENKGRFDSSELSRQITVALNHASTLK